MARAVILQFTSNAEAERFVRTVAQDGYAMANPEGGATYVEEMTAAACTVEGVLAVPTKHCTCGNSEEDRGRRGRRGRSRRTSGWQRSKHYGWWVCSNCNKPSRPAITHFITGMLRGANDLLPEIIGAGEPISAVGRWKRDGGASRSDGGFGRPELRAGDHFEHY